MSEVSSTEKDLSDYLPATVMLGVHVLFWFGVMLISAWERKPWGIVNSLGMSALTAWALCLMVRRLR